MPDVKGIINAAKDLGPGWTAVMVAIAILSWRIPAIIKAFSAFIDTWRRTSNKIKIDQRKAERALLDREEKKKGKIK